MSEYIKLERGPPCFTAKVESNGDTVATFTTSAGWTIDEKVLRKPIQGASVSAEGLKNDLEDMDRQTARSWRWVLFCSIEHLAAGN